MTNFLTLTNGAATAAQRVAPISGTTPASSRACMTLSGLVQAYSALPMTSKGGWQNAANTLNRTHNRVGKHKMTPANAYVTINSALIFSGQAVLNDAPTDLAAPPVLPAITVQGSAPATARDAAASVPFALHLVSLPYAPSIHVLAAPPAPAGKTTFPDTSFKPLGFINGLEGGGTDIADLYAAVYGTPEVGSQIAVKLVATSGTGIRLTPLVLSGVVTAAPADPTASPLHLG